MPNENAPKLAVAPALTLSALSGFKSRFPTLAARHLSWRAVRLSGIANVGMVQRFERMQGTQAGWAPAPAPGRAEREGVVQPVAVRDPPGDRFADVRIVVVARAQGEVPAGEQRGGRSRQRRPAAALAGRRIAGASEHAGRFVEAVPGVPVVVNVPPVLVRRPRCRPSTGRRRRAARTPRPPARRAPSCGPSPDRGSAGARSRGSLPDGTRPWRAGSRCRSRRLSMAAEKCAYLVISSPG